MYHAEAVIKNMVIDTAVQSGSRVKYCILGCYNTYLSDIFIWIFGNQIIYVSTFALDLMRTNQTNKKQ